MTLATLQRKIADTLNADEWILQHGATVTVTATGTNPRGPTYWVPPVITLRTNAMLSGSVLNEVWLTGSWADKSDWLRAWKSHSATAPLICTRPRHPDIQLDSDTIAAYVDQTFASHGLTDFTGWTNPSPPSLLYAGDWGSPRVPLFDTNYLIRAGTDLLRCRTLPCDCYFADMFVEYWESREASGATEDAAFRAVVADPQWEHSIYPVPQSAPRVRYRIWRETRVDSADSDTWYARVTCYIRGGTLTADTSRHRGHNTNGHSAVTAHLLCEGGLPFDDNFPTGKLTAVATRPAADGATLDFGEFPSYRSPPPASWLNLISPGNAESLEWRAEPVAFRAPNFNIIVD